MTRDTGQSLVFLSNSSFNSNDGCSFDHGVVVGIFRGAKSLLATTMIAFSLERTVEIGVIGCVLLSEPNSIRIPRIVRVRIIR